MQNLFDAAQTHRLVGRLLDRPLDILNFQRYRTTDGTTSKNHWTWNIAGNCETPVHRQMYGRPFKDVEQYKHNDALYAFNPSESKWLEIWARCRKCQPCMEQRARLWRGRILGELRLAQSEIRRTWFVTLTASPVMRWKYRMRATLKYNEGGKAPSANGGCLDFEHLSQTERFGLIHSAISADLTLWLKRIRHLPVSKWRAYRAYKKQQFRATHTHAETMAYIRNWEVENPCPRPARFSYVIVTEAHKKREVFPHYHVLLTEHEGELSEADLRTQWRSRIGFAEAKLVRGAPERMLYLCKYLTKDNRARVRASIGYGQHDNGNATNPLEKGSAAVTASKRETEHAPLKHPEGCEETEQKSFLLEQLKKGQGYYHGLSRTRLSGIQSERRLSKAATDFLSKVYPKTEHSARWEAEGSSSSANTRSPPTTRH